MPSAQVQTAKSSAGNAAAEASQPNKSFRASSFQLKAGSIAPVVQYAQASERVAQGKQLQAMANGHGSAKAPSISGGKGLAIQRDLNQGSFYRVTTAENGKNRTAGGNVSLAQQNNNPTTVVGELYYVKGFRSRQQVRYMELVPMSRSAQNAIQDPIFVPVGNDGYYTALNEPGLDDDTADNPYGVYLETIQGDAYNGQAPNQADITQGAVGDCWLIAPMLAMVMSAHFNQHIAGLVNAAQGQGYDVTLGNVQQNGAVPNTVNQHVSERIPALDSTQAQGGQDEFLYSQLTLHKPGAIAGGTATYPALIEKAVAMQMGGSYQDLDDNDASLGFAYLGHARATTINNPNPANQNYQTMVTEVSQNDAAGTATTKTNAASNQNLIEDRDDQQQVAASYRNLIEDHVYIILPATTNQRLYLHNPHGNMHPTGGYVPSNNVQEVIARIDYLPGPPAQQQQPAQQQVAVPAQQGQGQQQQGPQAPQQQAPAQQQAQGQGQQAQQQAPVQQAAPQQQAPAQMLGQLNQQNAQAIQVAHAQAQALPAPLNVFVQQQVQQAQQQQLQQQQAQQANFLVLLQQQQALQPPIGPPLFVPPMQQQQVLPAQQQQQNLNAFNQLFQAQGQGVQQGQPSRKRKRKGS